MNSRRRLIPQSGLLAGRHSWSSTGLVDDVTHENSFWRFSCGEGGGGKPRKGFKGGLSVYNMRDKMRPADAGGFYLLFFFFFFFGFLLFAVIAVELPSAVKMDANRQELMSDVRSCR